jgi:hypothetical protein
MLEIRHGRPPGENPPHATPPVLSHPPLPQAAPQSGRTYEALSAGRTITDNTAGLNTAGYQ